MMAMLNDIQIFSNAHQSSFGHNESFVFEDIEHGIIVQFVLIKQIADSLS